MTKVVFGGMYHLLNLIILPFTPFTYAQFPFSLHFILLSSLKPVIMKSLESTENMSGESK